MTPKPRAKKAIVRWLRICGRGYHSVERLYKDQATAINLGCKQCRVLHVEIREAKPPPKPKRKVS
jgi:hypothetical protein